MRHCTSIRLSEYSIEHDEDDGEEELLVRSCDSACVFGFVFQMEVELNVSPGPDVTPSDAPSVCIRAGCNNPPIHSKDWDREYCSNECVATHCRYTHTKSVH